MKGGTYDQETALEDTFDPGAIRQPIHIRSPDPHLNKDGTVELLDA